MKKLYTLFFLIIFGFASKAQISITQNDMPSAGDTARYTNAAINLFINYSATGANHTWDFSNLRAASQGLQEYIAVSSTNIIYAIVFANIPFFPNRSNVASNTTEFPTSPLVPLTNPYNFYYRNSSQYKQTGFGAEIAGLPIPITFNNHDVIYQLPLNYGDADTSNSDWNINVAGVGDLGYWQTRTNNVDGWGTLITQHDTYNVLRVKTIRAQRDTVAIDTLLGFALDRPLMTEYKWLANGEIIPVMQITTMEIFGFQVVTNIFFRDDFIKIETNALTSSVYCAGSSVTVPYTKYGTFNGPALFSSANVFTAQLSDSSGSFANPVNIGNVTSTQSGTINATIPAGTIPGTHYRIRVVSSNLPREGSDNGTDIVIINTTPVINNITASGSLSICAGGSVTLSIDTGDYYSYQWLNNGVAINGETASSYNATAGGDYTVDVTNPCGTVTSLIASVIIQPAPTASISNSTLTPCVGDTIILNSLTTDATGLQWQLNGVDITGEINADLSVTTDGTYTLIATGLCGIITSNALSITFGTTPAPAIVTSSTTTACVGDSILLSAVATGFTLQWQLNGADINGAVTSDLYAYSDGSYTLISSNNCGSSTSNAVALTFGTAPLAATVTSATTTACAGDSVLINATVANGNLQWQLNGVDIIGAVTASLYAFTDGDYILITSNNCGSSTSNTVSLTFTTGPAAAIITSASTSACAGDSILLSATGVTGLSLQWQINGVDIPGAINPDLYVNATGSYTLVVSNNCGAATSNGATITINPLPSAPVISQSNDTLYSTIAVAYQWYHNGLLITGANGINFHPTEGGAYTVVITDANGCTNTSLVYNYSGVGLESLETSMTHIYPNPVSSLLNIDWNQSQVLNSIIIQNILGENVLMINNANLNQKLKVDVNYLTAGIYNLQCITQNGILNYKFIKY